MGVGNTIDGAGGVVFKRSPNHIAGGAIFIRPGFANAGLHFRFKFGHGFLHRLMNDGAQPGIAGFS